MNKTAAALLILGYGSMVYGAWQLVPWLAWMVGGLLLVMAGGLSVDLDRRPQQ